MDQLLQVRRGVEFWECLNCGRVRRILPRQANTLFLVPPEFCSNRCRNEYLRSYRGRYEAMRGQLSFADLCEDAVNE